MAWLIAKMMTQENNLGARMNVKKEFDEITESLKQQRGNIQLQNNDTQKNKCNSFN